MNFLVLTDLCLLRLVLNIRYELAFVVKFLVYILLTHYLLVPKGSLWLSLLV